MRRVITLALLFLSTSPFAISQTTTPQQAPNAPVRKSPFADYVGAWTSVLEGHPWLTVRLSLQGTQLQGTLQRPHDFQFADDGTIKSVSQDQETLGVENAAVQGDGLLLTVKDPGTQQTSRYVMRLTGANTAEMKMVAISMPPGMPKPQPWKLTKAMAVAAPAR
jgi:hypothetical protein